MNFFFGFSAWKHNFIKPFFSEEEQKKIVFINPFFAKHYFKLALKKGLDKDSNIYIWGKKSFPLVEEFAHKHKLGVFRVEDGFIRSVGLGSDLTQPYSLVVDSRGIYFDPNTPSDLEYIFQTTKFTDELLVRARNIMNYLIEKQLSKYNIYENIDLRVPKDKKIVLVPGQVEDDASIRFGADGMSNLELLKSARSNAKDGYIIYKPHPDVLVGNRVGHIEESEALRYADRVVTEVGLESVLAICDEVHTMTSLVGFEALVRGKEVFTYGLPFYAGWGLTHDAKTVSRRERKLSIEELVAGSLLLYPRYIDPFTLQKTTLENVLEGLQKQKELYESSYLHRLRYNYRNYVSRKVQLLLRVLLLKR